MLYNLFLHPLSEYPGPLLMRISIIGYSYKTVTGTLTFDMLELHRKYVDVIHIALNELAFSHPQAWKDIMGYLSDGGAKMEKYDIFHRFVAFGPVDIVSAKRAEHSVLRHLMSRNFGDRGMQTQQPIIKQYIDLFIRRMDGNSSESKNPVDLTT